MKILSHVSAKEDRKPSEFQILHFYGSFSNDIVAANGLKKNLMLHLNTVAPHNDKSMAKQQQQTKQTTNIFIQVIVKHTHNIFIQVIVKHTHTHTHTHTTHTVILA